MPSPTSPPSQGFKIAIVGGGPAGLTLASLLSRSRHPIDFTVFESRSKAQVFPAAPSGADSGPSDDLLPEPNSGGMLDLHQESGIAAIKACGLYEEFMRLTGECSQAARLYDKMGNVLYEDDGGGRDRPEIDRRKLLRLLGSGIPDERIRWGWKVLSVKENSDGGGERKDDDGDGHSAITLTLSPPSRIHETEETFSLVIGADGAWSRVRSLLTPTTPIYSGTQCIVLVLRSVKTQYPHLSTLIGTGSFFALGDCHGIISQRGPQDSARIYVLLSDADETRFFGRAAQPGSQSDHSKGPRDLSWNDAASVKELLVGEHGQFAAWGPRLKELVVAACEDHERTGHSLKQSLEIRPLYMLPLEGNGLYWEHKPRLTMLGDAAHLMCPWAGEGVNLAMRDALDLATAIIGAYEQAEKPDGKDLRRVLDEQIMGFERIMLEKATEMAKETVSNGKRMFAEDGAMQFKEFFESIGAEIKEEPGVKVE